MAVLWVAMCAAAGVVAGTLVNPGSVALPIVAGFVTGGAGLAIWKAREKKTA